LALEETWRLIGRLTFSWEDYWLEERACRKGPSTRRGRSLLKESGRAIWPGGRCVEGSVCARCRDRSLKEPYRVTEINWGTVEVL
jgi:hypothetical protein